VTPERWEQIQEVFFRAQEVADAELAAFLDEACGEDSELRAEVLSLLASSEGGDGLLDRTFDEVVGSVLDAERQPERIGPYRIEGELGRGGMGVVWAAVREEEHLRRNVALKVLSRDRVSERMARRFRREQRILGSLEHPHIARLYNAGVEEDGTAWIAMERVDGEPIHHYCDRLRLPVASRLALFEQVVAAVDYAHRKLVIHRDLKPTNVLVTGEGVAKLLDFGIAKLVTEMEDGRSGADADGEPLTRIEQRILTPEYASPEQIEGEDLGTATDVYSLGILLHRIVTGLPARRHADGELDGSPSTQVTRGEGEQSDTTLDTVARDRGTTGRELLRQLRGEVDAIILKATRARPEDRYPSAAALLDDLVRYRERRPLTARPPSWGYRARKFAARNRVAVGFGGVLAVAIGVSGALLWQQRAETLREYARAEREAAKANEVSLFLQEMLSASTAEISMGEELAVGDVLERAVERLESGELEEEPEVAADLYKVLGRVYRSLGNPARALELLEAGVAALQSGPDPAPLLRADLLNEMGNAAENLGRYEDAERFYLEALDVRRAELEPPHALLSASLQSLGLVLSNLGRLDEAEGYLEEAISMDRALMVGDTSGALGYSLNSLGILRYQQGDLEGAADLFEETLEMRRRIYGPLHPRVATTQGNLAAILMVSGEHERAEPVLRETLAMNRTLHGDVHPDVANSLHNLAGNLGDQGRHEEARELLEEALSINRATLGEDSPEVARNLHSLGLTSDELGDPAEALDLLAEALSVAERTLPADHVDLGIITEATATVHRGMARCDLAEPLYRKALRTFATSQPEDSDRIATARLGLAFCRMEEEAWDEAEELLLAAWEPALAWFGPDGLPTIEARQALFELYTATGRPEEAERWRD
jgi:serine/threonine-protein kinase